MSLDALIGKPHDRTPFFKTPKVPRNSRRVLLRDHKKSRRISAHSPKRRAAEKAYIKARAEWKEERTKLDGFTCEFYDKGDRCRRKAQDSPHHKRKRGKYLSDKRYFMAVCLQHHSYIESHLKEAEALGYLIRDYIITKS